MLYLVYVISSIFSKLYMCLLFLPAPSIIHRYVSAPLIRSYLFNWHFTCMFDFYLLFIGNVLCCLFHHSMYDSLHSSRLYLILIAIGTQFERNDNSCRDQFVPNDAVVKMEYGTCAEYDTYDVSTLCATETPQVPTQTPHSHQNCLTSSPTAACLPPTDVITFNMSSSSSITGQLWRHHLAHCCRIVIKWCHNPYKLSQLR